MTAFGKPEPAAVDTERLFSECRDSLVRYLRSHAKDPNEAEDILQESFIRFFEARAEGEVIENPRAWLYRVARNLVIDRGRKRKPDLLDEKGWTVVEGSLASRTRDVETAIEVSQLPWDALTSVETECLRLRAEGLKFREIGEVLDISISTVVSYVARAVKKLRTSEHARRETSEHRRATAL